MKVKLLFVAFISCLIIFGAESCKGDMGDVGPAGPAGPQGPIGQDGVENCMDCHNNSQLISEKLFQWGNSVHATGGHSERSDASCAACHTSQGFVDRITSGEMAASMDIPNPLPPNCYTCHKIHQTYTEADWDLLESDPVTFWVGGETVDLGKGNLCINCHQARVPSPALPPVGENAVYTLTNKRYGPHHGGQGVVFTGSGAYEIGDGYQNSTHTALVENACITCHMATVMGANDAGGHTFRVTSEEGDLNTAGCVQCHMDTDELETMFAATQADISNLLDSLGNRMKDLGLLDDNLEYAVVPQDFTSLQLGVLWNYQYIKEDKSLGVHNYKYSKKLLENSIEALQ
jgi:hypothetical protein